MIAISGVTKSFPGGNTALKGVSLRVSLGEFVVILGPNGSGKTTLLRTINGLVPVTAGRIEFDGFDITKFTEKEMNVHRRRIGMIFQKFNLVQRMTVLQNVLCGRLGYKAFPSSITGRFDVDDHDIALRSLKRVGMEEYAHWRVTSLSGGQQQRVAVARALAQKPRALLADEPIASLDPKSATLIMDLLRQFADEDRITTIVTLHNVEFAKRYADRIIGINGGMVVFDGAPDELTEQVLGQLYGIALRTDEREDVLAAISQE